ncbi:MAG TPA: hypothetical protein VK498_00925 [Ferruginibacter sp.]|nr:hypothetical protein [Ferruginibacter sp.]
MKQSAPLLNGTDSTDISSGDKNVRMEEEPGNIQLLIDRAGDYLETRLELLKLKATQKSSDIVSSIVSTVILVSIMIMFFIILNIGLALLIGELLGKSYYGFFALAGFYLIAGLIFSAFRNKWVKEPVTNSFIKKVYN